MEWYEAEVKALERLHSARWNGERPAVFYGSSSIRLWETLGEDFDNRVVNLGFGGSTMEACDHFFDRLVGPVKPGSLVLYAGDNDLGDGRSVEQVAGWFASLSRKVGERLGECSLGFVSIKPSPARFEIIDRIRRVNALAQEEVERQPRGFYIDVYQAMLNGSGRPRAELFQEDGLHLNREGYRLWGRLFEAYRNKIFTS